MKLKLAHGFPMLALAVAVQNAHADVTASNDSASASPGQTISIDVSTNDEWTGNFYQLTDEFPFTTEAGGVVSYAGYGGELTYQAPEDFEGVDTFTYSADDGTGYGDSALVSITVGRSSEDEGPIESAVTGTNKKSTARAMDNICERVSNGDTDGIDARIVAACGEFAGMDSSELNDVMAQITPEEVLVMRRMMSSVSQTQTQRVYQHQSSLRMGRTNQVAVNANGISLNNYRGGTAGENQNSPWGVFGSVHIDGADHDQTDYESEYEMTGGGVTAGVDYRLSPNLVVGGALDWSRYEVDYSSNAGTVESDAFNFTGFLTWYLNAFSMDMQLGYGTGDFDTERNITFPAVAVASGSTSSDQYNLSLQADWTYSRQALTLRPFLRVDYMSTEIDGYTESSGSPWAMSIGSQDIDQSTASLGLDTTYAMGFTWGVFVPGLKISAVSESSADYSPVTFHLVGVESADGAFELQPDSEDSLFYQYDLNAVFLLKGGWSTFLSGQFISGFDNFSTYIISGGVRMEM